MAATLDKEGRRIWIYPRKPRGRFYRARTYVSWLLLAVMFAGPFIRIRGNPLLLLNVIERKFVILGGIFWPQDMIITAVTLLIFVTGILVFTAAFGRVWCGWTCPQTVLMEMVFRKIEYLIEGDSHQQRALDKAPWTLEMWVAWPEGAKFKVRQVATAGECRLSIRQSKDWFELEGELRLNEGLALDLQRSPCQASALTNPHQAVMTVLELVPFAGETLPIVSNLKG